MGLLPLNRILANANAASDEVNSVPAVDNAAIKNELRYARQSSPSPYANTAL